MSDVAGFRRLHDAWVVASASFITSLGAAGFRSTPSVPIDPLREEFGWSRATVGFAVSINVLLFGFIGPFAAALQQRFGLRRVTIVALAGIAVGALPWRLFLPHSSQNTPVPSRAPTGPRPSSPVRAVSWPRPA